MAVLVSDFHFDLPEELIAQEPLAERDASRMLHLRRSSGQWTDCRFRDFPEMLREDDLLVFNNTRVFPARLYGRREGARARAVSAGNPADFLRGRVEVLLTRQISREPNDWECLVRPGRKIGVGERLFFGERDELRAVVLTSGEFGERSVRFEAVDNSDSQGDFFAALERIGHVPLPPYIGRDDSSRDRERYQTVYAKQSGSVAAPTAGLHFTSAILERIRERGIETAEITLHVGLGTFQPVRVERVEDHKIHSESYFISEAAAEVLNRAIGVRRRVIAVGTTTVRTLEYAARLSSRAGGGVAQGGGVADVFIYPGFEFRVVGGVLTNFHLPQSSLLLLVSAFGGRENVLRAYRHAVGERYRFYSYGDCMFVE
jgi:S-adenosylmethionine:tRNA ribosyltransferase-isomerase